MSDGLLPLNAIITSLKSNNNLKKLQINNNSVFHVDFSHEISFKLTELVIDSLKKGERHQQRNINLFLKTQRDTLETLEIIEWAGDDVLTTISSMPRLHNLTLGTFGIDRLELAAASLPQNHSVKHLCLTRYWHVAAVHKNILNVFPKVELLEMFCITDELADLISETWKSLKHLSVHKFSLQNISNDEFFFNLEKFTCKCVSEGSEEMFNLLGVQLLKF